MGQPAARKTDAVAHKKAAGAILEGSPNVHIGMLPAARQTDPVTHNHSTEAIRQGEPTVLINGLPAARMGDEVSCTGVVASGCNTVLIGRIPKGECLVQAGESAAPFVAVN